MAETPTSMPPSRDPQRAPGLKGWHRNILAQAAETAPLLIIIVRKSDLGIVYLNGSARQALDPERRADVANMVLPDFIGVSSAAQLKDEILLHAGLMGKWQGPCVLRDIWGSEFSVEITCTYHAAEAGEVGPVYCFQAHRPTPSAATEAPLVSTDHELLHALMETLPDAVYFKDLQSRYIRVNRAHAGKSGTDDQPEALIGKTDFDRFSIEHAQRAYDDEQKIIRTGEPIVGLDEKETWPDGRVTWVSTTKLPLRDLAGRIVGTYGISRDITERKRNEEEMRKLSRIIEQAPLSVAITDLSGAIEYVNPMFTQVSGYTLAEVRGKNPRVLKSGLTPPEVFQSMWQTLSRGQVWRGELSNRSKSGEVFIENAVIAPVAGEHGRITHYVALKENVTELKRTEAALHESQERYRLIAENTADVIWLYDLGLDRFTYVSASVCKLRGYTADEVVGQTMQQMVPEAAAKQILRPMLAVPGGSDPTARTRTIQVDQLHKDGRVVPTEVVTTQLTDAEGHPNRILGVSRNITERKRVEKEREELLIQLQLAQKLESIGLLAAGIAHEINTPTQFITDNTHFLTKSFAELTTVLEGGRALREAAVALPELADQAKALAALEEEVDLAYLCTEIPTALKQSLEGLGRVGRIVQSLKEFSHPQNAQRNATDLNHVISTAITVSRHEWKYVAEVVTDFAPDLPAVPCVVDEFNQVLVNLLVNAAHAIETAQKERNEGAAQGIITVRTRVDGDWALVEVEDTGTGIPDHVLPRIFEPFFTTKKIGKGTGQGLSIVQTVIVRKHQGTVGVTTQLGRGTTFHLRLPFVIPPETSNL